MSSRRRTRCSSRPVPAWPSRCRPASEVHARAEQLVRGRRRTVASLVDRHRGRDLLQAGADVHTDRRDTLLRPR